MARIQYFQEGGGAPMPEQGGAPQGGDPTAEIQAMVQEWAQTQDPQLAQQTMGILAEAMGIPIGGAPQVTLLLPKVLLKVVNNLKEVVS